jgi:serine protease AprX
VLDNKAKYNIRVVNLSLNSSVAQSYHTSPLDAACEILWFNGIVVVVSAGNNGTATLFPPANDPFVITVGATDDKGTLAASDDGVATFSAYGLTESGFAKPDLVAPGRNIIGLLPENDKLTMSAARVANRIDKTYFKMSGTSVSAPMVAGAVTLLLQDEPNLTPDQVKYRLLATANKNWPGYNAAKAGAGYLDVYAAVHGATVQSANTGLPASQLLWTGSEPVNWNSVNWESANWESVNWESVNWESVNWESVNWESDYWGP